MDAKLINTLELNGDVSIPEKYVGPRGYSAYELAVKEGFEGTIDEWLESLRGDPFVYEDFTPEQLDALVGPTGKSAYEIAVDNGFEGTEEEWLEYLRNSDELITIKDTSIMNISQLPIDKLPCCFHMIGSRIMGTYFNDDIIYISRIIDDKFSVHTMDGVIMKVFYNQEEGTLRLDDYLNLVDDVTLGDKLKDYYKKSQVDALIPDVIKRCVWFYEAGDDISLFAEGNTNVASFTEFIGHKPAISNNNVGIILVDNKLYWTKFNITAINENSGGAYQEFTQDPILIGPVDSASDELITIKNTEITNISQLPISNTAYCAHLVNCDFFYQFADDIIHIEHRPANMRVVVHTIDGAEFSLTYDGDGNFDFDNVSSTSVATEKYVYEHYYDKGQIDAKLANISSNDSKEPLMVGEVVNLGDESVIYTGAQLPNLYFNRTPEVDDKFQVFFITNNQTTGTWYRVGWGTVTEVTETDTSFDLDEFKVGDIRESDVDQKIANAIAAITDFTEVSF